MKQSHTAFEKGYTLVEVVVALGLAAIVMASVFALLSRGFTTARVETERADLQAQARSALERVSRDILEAGAGLPPEFPSFVPYNKSADMRDLLSPTTDVIEVVRSLDRPGLAIGEPFRVKTFDGQTAELDEGVSVLQPGDLVLVYDNAPRDGIWILGVVSEVKVLPTSTVEILTSPGSTAGGVKLPDRIAAYNRVTLERPYPTKGFLAPVSVVTYYARRETPGDTDAGEAASGESVLMRRVNWGNAQPVAFMEGLEIRYEIGSTVSDGGEKLNKGIRIQTRPKGVPQSTAQSTALSTAPVPQPDPSKPLESVVSAVLVSVTARSHSANLEGSTAARPGEPGVLRATFSSRVAPRNVLAGLGSRDGARSYN